MFTEGIFKTIVNLQGIEVCIRNLSLHMVCTHDVIEMQTMWEVYTSQIHTLCKPCAHCANLCNFFTPSLPRANRVNWSNYFTKFATYLHSFCCGLLLFGQGSILVYTWFETGQRAWRHLKDPGPSARKGLHKVWINWVYQCKLLYLFAQGLYLVYIWFTSNAD